MRNTIHLVSATEFWPFALGVRRARREWAAKIAGVPPEVQLRERAADLREALEDGPRSVAELGGLASGFLGNLSLWVDLVRVPPSGTWKRRRADRLALAETWKRPEFPLRGQDLAGLGISPGPAMGQMLRELEQEWIDSDFLLGRDALMERAAARV